MTNRAVTLVEICLALVILMVALVPLTRISSSDAVTVIETEKIQMAERILESIKTEVMAMPFKRFYERIDADGVGADEVGPFVLSDGFYPISFSEVITIQKEYKDFEVVGTWTFLLKGDKPDRTMVQTDIACSFSRAGNAPPVVRNKSFLIVKP
ncbi:MAG: hypothetical protein KKB51_21920 [Candidatus Riflebacteria bacterium]|nr:hypothetical protein [Candidatus Riflebacteria bacterium]